MCRRLTFYFQWTVLQCGHCYCKACLNEVKRHGQNRRNLCCPMCRELTALGEISYVTTKSQSALEQPEKMNEDPAANLDDLQKLVELKKLRKQSAKAEVIVQKLKEILREHPEDKVLIFSSVSESLIDQIADLLQLSDFSGQKCWTFCSELLPRMAFCVLRPRQGRSSKMPFSSSR